MLVTIYTTALSIISALLVALNIGEGIGMKFTTFLFIFCFNVLLVNAILLCVKRSALATKITLSLITFVSITLFYTQITKGYIITPSILFSIIHTTPSEVESMVSVGEVLFALILISIALFPIFKAKNLTFKPHWKMLISCLCTAIFLVLILKPSHISPKSAIVQKKKASHKAFYINKFKVSAPYSLIHSTIHISLASLQDKHSTPIKTSFIATPQSDVKVVLIIGESLRFDRLGINGYLLNTTPNLAQLPKKNLINFGKAPNRSCDINTFLSVPCILSGLQDGTPYDLFKIFHTSGFKTSLHSPHSPHLFKNVRSSLLKHAMQYSFNAYSSDDNIAKIVESELDESKGKKLFTVIQMLGSHSIGVEKQIKNQASVLQPICNDKHLRSCYDSQGKKHADNSYDNTVIFTDQILAEAILKLKNENAILFFTSDHGELIGENGYFNHSIINPDGTKPEKQFEVPVLVWVSDSFIKNNQKQYNQIVQASSSSTNHLQLYHSVISCLGIKVEGLETSDGYCE